MTHPIATLRNGFAETSLVLYAIPAPKIATEVVWVIDRGMLKEVAISIKIVEVTSVEVAFGYLIKKNSFETRLIGPSDKRKAPTKIAIIEAKTEAMLNPPTATIIPSVLAPVT